MSDKKPYSFHTLKQPLTQSDAKKKVSILGMGKDNKWALLAPYADKSMIRDLLAFEIARPWMEYTPQGRLCEVYLDGTYYGVYILCEVVSKGKYRLDLPDPGEDEEAITGGYIVEVGTEDKPHHVSKYHPVDSWGRAFTDDTIYLQYEWPDFEDLTPAQVEYIDQCIDNMEDAFASSKYKDPEVGYAKYIDVQSFMDYQLNTEISRNVDGYRLSTKLYKRRDSVDSRFKMVIWDNNLAFGNARHNEAYKTNTWAVLYNTKLHNRGDYMIPFWWYKLARDKNYTNPRKERWAQYRENNVRMDRLMATIDSLANEVTSGGAEARNAQAWPRWGIFVWPNYYIAENYQDEIDYLKNWLTERIAWLDNTFGYVAPPLPPQYVPGDVNGDGQVSVADINVLVDIIMGGEHDEETMARADVNEDKEYSIADISCVINIILAEAP